MTSGEPDENALDDDTGSQRPLNDKTWWKTSISLHSKLEMSKRKQKKPAPSTSALLLILSDLQALAAAVSESRSPSSPRLSRSSLLNLDAVLGQD